MQRWLYNTYLHCGEDHTSVYVLELRHDAFTDVFALFFILHNVSAQCVENGHPAPLRTLVEAMRSLPRMALVISK